MSKERSAAIGAFATEALRLIEEDEQSMELTVDNARHEANAHRDVQTGIFVRAKTPGGRWINADIADLDKASLLTWLKSRGGDNPWAENTVGILLGHGSLHEQQ